MDERITRKALAEDGWSFFAICKREKTMLLLTNTLIECILYTQIECNRKEA